MINLRINGIISYIYRNCDIISYIYRNYLIYYLVDCKAGGGESQIIRFSKIKVWLGSYFNAKPSPSPSLTPSNPKESEKRSTVLLIDNDGLSFYTSYLACGLCKYRDVVFCGFSKEDYEMTRANQEKRLKFYCIREKLPKGQSSLNGIIWVFYLLFILFDILTKTKYDIVHIQEHLPAFFVFIPMLKLKGKQICWTLHDSEIFNPTGNWRGTLRVLFLKLVSQPALMKRYADVIIIHAHTLKQQLKEKGVNENKMHVIPHFDYSYLLDYDHKNKDLRRSDDYISHKGYILFFGSLAPWKGVDILIRAAKLVSKQTKKKFTVVIAGRAWGGYNNEDLLTYYKSLLNKEDYEYVHIFNKYITSPEIPELLNKSAFLVLPYTKPFQYSTSGVIPLAYTFSRPVIVSNIPSLAEYVDHDKTGFIFKDGNSTELAKYITELLENDSKCIEMGKNSYQKMLQVMSLGGCCKILNDLYIKP